VNRRRLRRRKQPGEAGQRGAVTPEVGLDPRPEVALDGLVMLGPLLLAAVSLGAGVFPEDFCERIPEARPEVKAWVARNAPGLAPVPVRELDERTALETIRRASASGWGSLEFFTNAAFRESCTFYFSREALRSVDAAFELDLLTPFRGTDTGGQRFEMEAALAGRGRLLLLYDRDGIVYTNERENRDFKLASRVELSTPSPGVLENVRGVWTRVSLLGWIGIRSLVKQGETVEVRAGRFTSETALRPILAREGAARTGRPGRTVMAPAPPGRTPAGSR
jgi:hypothetical protein